MYTPLSRRHFLQLAAATAVSSPLIAQQEIPRPGKPKFKLSLNAYSFNDALRSGATTLDELFLFCAELGFDAVDLTGYYIGGYPAKPEPDLIRWIKYRTHTLGLAISGTGVRNDFSLPDPAARREEIERVKRWVDVAADLGAPVLRIFSASTEPVGDAWKALADRMAVDIRTCVEYGKRCGVIVAVQNHAHFLKTAEDILYLIRQVNHPWFGIVEDIGSFRGPDPFADIAKIAPHAVSWQIKENMTINAQTEPTDLNRLFQVIRNSGYRGYLPLETLGPGDPRAKVRAFYDKVTAALAAH